MNYGHPDFIPNTHFVRGAKHGPPNVEIAEGFSDAAAAIARAVQLAEDAAMQDVVLITEVAHEAAVKVLKGVQWFCEKELHARYAGRWKVVHEFPAQESIHLQRTDVAYPSVQTEVA